MLIPFNGQHTHSTSYKDIQMLTQAELQSKLHYNQETGVFTRLKNNKIAGCKNQNGYIMIGLNNKDYRAHRLAWLYIHGYIPEFIDHINGIKDNNKLSNLRPATKQQNSFNTKLRSCNTSKVKNVSWSKEKAKWKSYIKINGKQIHLGYTIDYFESCCLSFSAINKYHKEFANRN